jgi:hypothetical protein
MLNGERLGTAQSRRKELPCSITIQNGSSFLDAIKMHLSKQKTWVIVPNEMLEALFGRLSELDFYFISHSGGFYAGDEGAL